MMQATCLCDFDDDDDDDDEPDEADEPNTKLDGAVASQCTLKTSTMKESIST